MIRPDVPRPEGGEMPASLRDAYRATEPGRTAQPFADRAFRARIDQIATRRAAGGPLARLFRSLVGGPRLALNGAVLSAALIFMSVGAATYVFGPVAQTLEPPSWLRGQTQVLGRDFPTYRGFLIICGAVLVTALWLALERTRFGAQIRAAVDNLRMAQTLGINTSKLFAIAFALGSGLAALGGGLGADMLSVGPTYALEHLVRFLIVVAVGGLGSIRGPFIAAVIVGVTDTAFKYLAPELGAFFIYVITMAILLWRPRGLFGYAR